jgi:hypothetical protein
MCFDVLIKSHLIRASFDLQTQKTRFIAEQSQGGGPWARRVHVAGVADPRMRHSPLGFVCVDSTLQPLGGPS